MLSILKETKDYILVNKPSGLITESNPYEDALESQVRNYFKSKYHKDFVGVVHRLDRVTSGVVLFAKKKSVLQYFNRLFETKQIRKTYLAITNQSMAKPKAKLTHYLRKDNKLKQAIIVSHPDSTSKMCELSYVRIGVSGNLNLLKVSPKTGRFHQIRAQLSFIGNPIFGDILYQSTEKYKPQSVCLHAFSLEFIEFDSKEKTIVQAPIPSDMPWKGFNKLVNSKFKVS